MSPDRPLFSLRGLGFSYEQEQVLCIKQLDLEANRITVLAGGNGSGKTTLLKLLNGLLNPSSGQILFRGRLLGRSGFRGESVLVHQNPYLFRGTVFQNVAYGLRIRRLPRRVIRQKVRQKLALVGLEGFEQRKSHRLSGGEKQRVAVARALVLEPKVLLLDEPTANVDPRSMGLLESLIRQLARATTVILSSHHLGFAYRIADCLIRLEEGRPAPTEVNILKGRVVGGDQRFTYFQTGRGRLRCPAQEGEFTTAVLPLEDVILSRHPLDTSAQNRFQGTVRSMVRVGGLYRLEMDCGFPLEAYITEYSVEQLHVTLNGVFHVTFKASAIKLY